MHFGKAASFRHAGLPVPSGTTADNIARLDALLADTAARRLVFLGDFLHARSGAQPALWQQLRAWRARHAQVAMDLVLGNHDRHAGTPPTDLDIALREEPWAPVASAPVLAAHHPHQVAGHTVLAGHLHPRVVLNGRERIGPWGRGLDRDEAEAQARALAEEEAARYVGDWTITLERSTDA